jgi:hypothetical protein
VAQQNAVWRRNKAVTLTHPFVWAADEVDARERVAWPRHEGDLVKIGVHDRSPGRDGVDLPDVVLATIRAAADIALVAGTCRKNVVCRAELVLTFSRIPAANVARVSDCHTGAVAESDVHQREGAAFRPFLSVVYEAAAKQASDKFARKVSQFMSPGQQDPGWH